MPKHKETILVGWKEIENNIYLTRQTLIARGFPVYRTGRRGERVYAVLEELERYLSWLARNTASKKSICLASDRLGRRLRVRRAWRRRLTGLRKWTAKRKSQTCADGRCYPPSVPGSEQKHLTTVRKAAIKKPLE